MEINPTTDHFYADVLERRATRDYKHDAVLGEDGPPDPDAEFDNYDTLEDNTCGDYRP
jgi:hypothetical protein